MLRKFQRTQYYLLAVLLILLSGCAVVPEPQTGVSEPQISASDIVFPHDWVGNIDEVGLEEPSGICFHFSRGTLFVVGDEGHVYEIDTNGKLLKQKRLLSRSSK